MDHLAFVEHAGVGGFEEVAQAEFVQLPLEGGGVHRGEHEGADAERGAPFEFFAGVREHGDRSDRGIEGRAEMGFEFL